MIASALASLLPERAAESVDPRHPRDPGLARLFGFGGQVKSGVRVDGDTVLGIPAVLRGVNIIGNAMMKTRPSIYKRLPERHEEDRVRDREHPSWKFVTRRANAHMSAGYFRKTLTSWGILRGNGLGYLVRDGAGRIVEGLPLPPDRSGMAVYRRGQEISGTEDVQEGDVIRYWTIVGGEVRTLLPENVIHIKGLSQTGYWGIDIVDALAESFGLSMAPRNFAASFFGQGATPSGIIFIPPGLKEAAQKDFAEKIRKANEGLGRSHRLMILEETAKYQQTSIDPEKAQMIATREFELKEIANIIGIQSHKIGDSSRVSYNSLEQSAQDHLDDDIDPHLQIWEDELGEKCLTENEKAEDSHYVEFNRDALVRVNMAVRTERDKFERTHGLATANQILRRSNRAPIGDVGETYMVPANMTILSADGLPTIRGQAAPEPKGGPAASAEAFHELALCEVERLAKRATGEACRQAKQGDAAYLAFLDQLAGWTFKPASVAELLAAAAGLVHQRLSAFAEPPFVAAELHANVAAAADSIITEAIAIARNTLET